jgi:hypothetical protein
MDHPELMSLNVNESDQNTTDEHSSSGQTESSSALPAQESPPAIADGATEETAPEEAKAPRGKSSELYEKFLSDLEKLPDADAKLQFVLDFMEAQLSQSGTPHFKTFWDARTVSLNFFKEAADPVLRATLWTKYEELTKEARRLKEMLDEQSAFAAEQFEIAIAALEQEMAAFDSQLDKLSPVLLDFPARLLPRGLDHYEALQKQLNLLNVHASRINALRKELIRTEMRVRQKNKFFQRLSVIGDLVFPKRKELIKEVSQAFAADVEALIAAHFGQEPFEQPLFSLREEIKMLQGMAKQLTLNTQAFNQTRLQLSQCWDKVKEADKERKKERAQQKTAHKQNLDQGLAQVKEFCAAYENQQFSTPEEALKKLDELIPHLRTLELGREEEEQLKGEVQQARKRIREQLQEHEKQREQQQVEKEKQRRHKITELKAKLEGLLKQSDSVKAEELAEQRDLLLQEAEALQLTKAERHEYDKFLKPLRDLISEKQEDQLLTLSEDERQSLQQLKEVLQQKRERRQEIKDQIEQFRKAGGASGLDFEQAMQMNEQVSTEKERLDKINQSIQELESKIQALQRSLKKQ